MNRVIPALFCLYATALLTSMAAMELFSWVLFVVAAVQIVWSLRTKSMTDVWQELRLGPDLWVLLFLGWVVLGAFLQISDWSRNLEILGYMRWVLLLYALTYLLKSYLSESWERGFRWLMIVFIAIGVYAVYQTFSGDDLIRAKDNLMPMGRLWRSIGFFTNPLTFSYAIGVSGLLVLAYATVVGNRTWRAGTWVSAAASLMVVISIVFSGSRGAWVALVPAAAVLFASLGRKVFVAASAAFIAVLGLVLFAYPDILSRATTIADVKESSNAGRVEIWRATLAMAKDHPWLGTGLNQNSRLMASYYQRLEIENGLVGHAHNNFLQILVGTGIVGFIAFIAFSVIFLTMSYQLWRRIPASTPWLKSLALGALAAQVYFHIGGLTEANFVDGEVNHNLIAIWAVIAALYGRESAAVDTKVAVHH